ncbi:MAG: hypothetical protein IKG36_01975, partial [Mycoplasmataceae bacterium]|nr:hypothetical protein [Mycoplasmataceae bacterium]
MSNLNKNNNSNQEFLTNTSIINVELNDALFKFIDAEETGKSSTSLVGKPRLLIVDIIKRFIKNYVALFALILIILISLLCLIFPLIS